MSELRSGPLAGTAVTPVERSGLGEQVATTLRRLIVAGDLSPGYRLVESNLSHEFGVSRGPVREALTKLRTEGLIEADGRSLAVVGVSPTDLVELFSLRRTLESFALRLCVERGDADLSGAETSLATMDSAAEARDAFAFAVADLDFHTHFYRASGHRRLLKVWQEYRPTFAALLEVSTAQDRDLHPSAASHRAILDHARRGRLREATAELVAHLDGARRRLETFRSGRGDGDHA